MSNMSYCRFENTLADLQDCYQALHESNPELSDTEEDAKKELLNLVETINQEFND